MWVSDHLLGLPPKSIRDAAQTRDEVAYAHFAEFGVDLKFIDNVGKR